MVFQASVGRPVSGALQTMSLWGPRSARFQGGSWGPSLSCLSNCPQEGVAARQPGLQVTGILTPYLLLRSFPKAGSLGPVREH